MEYTREQLIKICEQAFVPHKKWNNRDSAMSQESLGKAYAFLKTGCHFEIQTKNNTSEGCACVTNERTIWIQFWVRDFMWFEGCDNDERGNENLDYHFYLPTQKRLDEVKGSDWY